MATVEGQYGRVDALVNVTGLMAMPCPLVSFDDDVWGDLFRVNVTGAYYMTKAVLPGMLQRKLGRIIFFSSISATKTYANFAAYAAAKNALLALGSAISQEVAERGVTVNSILLGCTETKEMHRIWGDISAASGVTEDSAIRTAVRTERSDLSMGPLGRNRLHGLFLAQPPVRCHQRSEVHGRWWLRRPCLTWVGAQVGLGVTLTRGPSRRKSHRHRWVARQTASEERLL